MNKKPNGLLIIAHGIFFKITRKEIRETLSESDKELDIEYIDNFDALTVEYGGTKNFHWRSAMAVQKEILEKDENARKLELVKSKGYEILYFGAAPIPLAIHLGYLINSWPKTRAFLKHHDKRTWEWPKEDIDQFTISGRPKEKSPAHGEVVIRMGTSFKVDSSETSLIVPETIREIEFFAEKLGRDIIGSHESLDKYAKAFRGILDSVKDNLPNTNAIHFFGAIPVGLAFRIGQEINPTMHKPVYVYEYYQSETPPHKEAFAVQEEPSHSLVISNKERKRVEDYRLALKKHLETEVHKLVRSIKKTGEADWFKSLYPKLVHTVFQSPYWQNLHPLHETELGDSKVSEKPFDKSGYRIYQNGEWWFSDEFLHGLIVRLDTKKDDIYLAIRLFWIHEALHRRTHGIGSDNSSGLGLYPQVLAEADYQADVYALLHEFERENPPENEVTSSIGKMIHVMTETMWAFDQLEDPQEIEVRRLNRYLIWYLQLVRIESATCKSLDDVLNILGQKPLIELRLNSISTVDGRKIKFNLRNHKSGDIGICIFHKNHVQPFGNDSGQLPLTDLINGFINRDSGQIKDVMRALLLKPGIN